MSTTRPEHLTIGKFAQATGGIGQPLSNPASTSTSPNELSSGGSTNLRSPFGIPTSSALGPGSKLTATRSGAGSPSHDPLAPPGSARFLPSKRYVLSNFNVFEAQNKPVVTTVCAVVQGSPSFPAPKTLFSSSPTLTQSCPPGPGKYKLRRAYSLSIPGQGHQPAGTPPLSGRTYPNHLLMALTTRNLETKTLCHRHAELELARCRLAYRPALRPIAVAC